MNSRTVKIHNGTYTVTSPKGTHRTFSIRTVQKGNLKDSRILSLLTGPDNTRDYTGFAFVNDDGIKVWHRHDNNPDWGKYGKLLWSLATEGQNSPYYVMGYRLLIEGKCLVCNRKLTEPESITTGIGPECRKRIGH